MGWKAWPTLAPKVPPGATDGLDHADSIDKPLPQRMQTMCSPNHSFIRSRGLLASSSPAILLLLLALEVLPAACQVTNTNSIRKIYRDRVEPHWLAGNDRFWYRLDLPGDAREFVLVDAVQGKRGSAFDHERLAQALSQQTGKPVQTTRLPVDSIEFSNDGKSLTLTTPDGKWECDLETYHLKEAVSDVKKEVVTETNPAPKRRKQSSGQSRPPTGIRSPDGAWEALVRSHNLYLRDVKAGTESALTYDANPTDTYASNAERDRAVEMEYEARAGLAGPGGVLGARVPTLRRSAHQAGHAA
jgi:hypothetical protein